MVNWTDIHPDFTEEIVQQWLDNGFSFEQTKEWTKALGDYFEIADYNFCAWLKYSREISVEKITEYDIDKLIDEYNEEHSQAESSEEEENESLNEEESEDWTTLHHNFAKKHWSGKTYQQEWKKSGIIYEEAKEWIEVGLEPREHHVVIPLKESGITPQDYVAQGEDAQAWLEKEYPLEKRKEVTELKINNKKLTNSLVVADWPNLKQIECSSNRINSLTVKNCPQLTYVRCYQNKLVDFSIIDCSEITQIEIAYNSLNNLSFLTGLNPDKLISLSFPGNNFPPQDLTMFSKFKNLEILYLHDNPKIYGSLKPLKNMNELEHLDIKKTNIISGLEYLPENLVVFWCSGKLAKKIAKYNRGMDGFDIQSWREDNSKLIEKAQLEIMIDNLKQALTNQYISEVTDKALQAFIYQQEGKIIALKKQLEKKQQAQIEVPLK